MRIVGRSLPTVSIRVARAASSAFAIARLGLVGSARSTRASSVIRARLVPLERIEQLTLVADELL